MLCLYIIMIICYNDFVFYDWFQYNGVLNIFEFVSSKKFCEICTKTMDPHHNWMRIIFHNRYNRIFQFLLTIQSVNQALSSKICWILRKFFPPWNRNNFLHFPLSLPNYTFPSPNSFKISSIVTIYIIFKAKLLIKTGKFLFNFHENLSTLTTTTFFSQNFVLYSWHFFLHVVWDTETKSIKCTEWEGNSKKVEKQILVTSGTFHQTRVDIVNSNIAKYVKKVWGSYESM